MSRSFRLFVFTHQPEASARRCCGSPSLTLRVRQQPGNNLPAGRGNDEAPLGEDFVSFESFGDGTEDSAGEFDTASVGGRDFLNQRCEPAPSHGPSSVQRRLKTVETSVSMTALVAPTSLSRSTTEISNF